MPSFFPSLNSLGPSKKQPLFDLSKAGFRHLDSNQRLNVDQKGRLYTGKRGWLVRFVSGLWRRTGSSKVNLTALRARSEVNAFQKGVRKQYKDAGSKAVNLAKKNHSVKHLNPGYIREVYRHVHEQKIDAMKVGTSEFRSFEDGISPKARARIHGNKDVIANVSRDMVTLMSDGHRKPLSPGELRAIPQFVLHHGLGVGASGHIDGFSERDQSAWAAHVKSAPWRK